MKTLFPCRHYPAFEVNTPLQKGHHGEPDTLSNTALRNMMNKKATLNGLALHGFFTVLVE